MNESIIVVDSHVYLIFFMNACEVMNRYFKKCNEVPIFIDLKL